MVGITVAFRPPSTREVEKTQQIRRRRQAAWTKMVHGGRNPAIDRAMLHFPFWMARLAESPEHRGLLPLAFSSPEALSAYLSSRKTTEWNAHLVNRYSAPAFLAELHDQGHSAICVDVNVDGSGGTALLLAEVLDCLK